MASMVGEGKADDPVTDMVLTSKQEEADLSELDADQLREQLATLNVSGTYSGAVPGRARRLCPLYPTLRVARCSLSMCMHVQPNHGCWRSLRLFSCSYTQGEDTSKLCLQRFTKKAKGPRAEEREMRME